MISSETLRRYPYFADVSEERLRDVAKVSNEQNYASGTVLFRENDKANYLYIIVDGEVDIQYMLGNGELRTIDTLVSGELIMWSALVEPYRSTAIGTTRKATALVAIDAKMLRTLCEQDHDLGYRMHLSLTKLLANRLEGARVQLATID
jgi:CRP/FNR family transcriptional regulator, cyclic AMP receptor protein